MHVLVLAASLAFALLGGGTNEGTDHDQARANAYDDGWQDGPDGWAAHVAEILEAKASPTPGMTLFVGDSLTGGSSAMAAWPRFGEGKTPQDEAILEWMHVGDGEIGVTSLDGFGLATPYHCSNRSYTVGDGLGAWHFLSSWCGGGGCMPTAMSQQEAFDLLDDCSTYPNLLNVETILTAFDTAQFVVYESNLHADHPEDPYIYEEVIDLLLANDVVPIIITYTYRGDPAFNELVDPYNAALVQLAEEKRLPLIDFQAELLARRPLEEWPGNFLSDGVHYSSGGGGFSATSDPYLPGGDPTTHTTGDAMMFNGYGLRAWLSVQKMKEIKAVAVDRTPGDPGPEDPTSGTGGATSGEGSTSSGGSDDGVSSSSDGLVGSDGLGDGDTGSSMTDDPLAPAASEDADGCSCRSASTRGTWIWLAVLLACSRRRTGK